jgi:tetratricopeptide (TPR) repeat protein
LPGLQNQFLLIDLKFFGWGAIILIMEHNIEREPLSFLLQQVYLKNLSGHLTVICRDFQIVLYFVEGKLVNGLSTRFDEKISVILHLMGIISEEQYNFLSGLHQFSDDQVGEILLEHHFAKKKDIFFARIYQLRRIAISVFSLKGGKWSFTPGDAHPPFKEIFEIPLAGILVDGARSIDHISFYASQWFLHTPFPAKEIPPQLEVYFTDQELDFYARLLEQSPRRTCQELIARLNVLPVDFWRKILVFHLLGLLQFQKNSRGIDIGRDIADLLVLHQQIKFTPGNVFALLGLAPDAPAGIMEITRNEFLLRFSPERFGSAAAPEIKNIARAVCQWLQAVAAPLDSGAVQPEKKPRQEFLEATKRLDFDPQLPDAVPELIFSPAAAPPAATVAAGAHERAWEMLLRSKELYEQREFDLAIPLLKQAIKLEPGQGDFYYLLGLCQGESEIMKNDAEINLKKAIELKSWSADPVYALGTLYRGQGKMKLAERCFNRVKEIAYDHTGASRALVDLRRLQPGKKNKVSFLKKKIF